VRRGIKVIVQKKQKIAVQGSGENRITLSSKPEFGLDELNPGKKAGRIAHIRWFRIRHHDGVRLPLLVGQKGDGFR
jgi:hypothetical protein